MKLSFKIKFLSISAITLLSIMFINTAHAYAAERTWDGEGSDNKFSTAENWSDDTAPVNGDSIKFVKSEFTDIEDCVEQNELYNDLDSATITFAGITLGEVGDTLNISCSSGQSWANAGFKISGQAIKLSGNLVDNFINSYIYTEADIVATADISLAGNFKGDINIGSNTVTLNGGGQQYFDSVTGTGLLIIGSSSITHQAAITTGFTGAVTVNEGMRLHVVYPEDSSLNGASSITVNNGVLNFSAQYNQTKTFDAPIIYNGGDLLVQGTNTGTVVLSSDITVTAATIISPSAYLKFTGAITGKNYFTVKAGLTGKVTWPDNSVTASELEILTINDDNKSTYCTATGWGLSVSTNSKYIWDVVCPEKGTESPTYVYGIFAGQGSIGKLKIGYGGTIAPGQSPGILSTGDLTFEEGATYEFEVAGADAGEFDQINVTGTVVLGNGTLKAVLLDGFTPSGTNSFVIINNDGTDAVDGKFTGLTEGATVEIDGIGYFTISYAGGDGNDVVLTALPGVGKAGDAGSMAAYFYVASIAAAVVAIVSQRKKLLLFSNRKRR